MESPSRAPSPAEGSDPFVGREAELARLEEHYARATAGSGAMVLVTGDAGRGKSALIEELLGRVGRHEPTALALRGRCAESYGTGEAYLPFLEALGSQLAGPRREELARLLRTYAPTWCVQLPTTSTPREREALQRQTVGATKERMVRDMGDALGALSASATVVLVVEDLQWADPSSIDLLRHLADRLASRRMLALVTYRPGELEVAQQAHRGGILDRRMQDRCHEIALGPLAPEEVAAYLHRRFSPHRFPPGLAAILHDKTEGHPLFVASLVDFLRERGDIAWSGDHWALGRDLVAAAIETPESLRGMVRRRLEVLPEEDRLALQYASVMGREFLSTVLARLLGADEIDLEERLDRLSRLHRLAENAGEEDLPDGSLATRYRFTHGLCQEALYEDLVSKRRIALHRQVAEELVLKYGVESRRIAAPVALHYERGRDFASAITYLVHAGDNAAALYANDEAREHFARALALLERLPPPERGARSALLGQRLGGVLLAAGRFDEAAATLQGTLEEARSRRDAEAECAALTGLCTALFFSHRIPEMAIRAEEALQAAERAGSSLRRLEAMVLVAMILQDEGDLGACRTLLDEILGLARSVGHEPSLLSGLTYRGIVHYWNSEYEQAEELLAEALGLASEQREGLMVLVVLMFLGLARGNRGRLSEGLATLDEGIALARRNGDRFWLPRLANSVGWIHRELQDFDGALVLDREGLGTARELGMPEAEATAQLNIALDLTQAGRWEEAEEAFAAVPTGRDAWFGWLYEIRLAAALGEYWLGRGDLDRAAGQGARLLDSSARHEAHTYAATAHKLLAEVALARDMPAAAAAHGTAVFEQLRGFPAPLFAWKAHAALGRLRLRLGDIESARAAYAEAAVVVRAVAGRVTDEGLRACFLESPAVREVLEAAGTAGAPAERP